LERTASNWSAATTTNIAQGRPAGKQGSVTGFVAGQPQTSLQSNKSPTYKDRATSNQLPRHCKGNNTSKQIQHKEHKIHTSKSRSNKKTSKNKQKHTQQRRHVQGSLPGVADAITFWSGELERTPAANWSAEL
jgi:hypothetical protein